MKAILKNLYIFISGVCAIPIAIIFIIVGKFAIFINAYSDISLVASKIPFLIGQKVRYIYYKATLAYLGKQVVFKYGSFCQYSTAKIGNRVHFGYYNTIGEVKMGDDIVIGGFVNFLSGTNQHSFENEFETIRSQKAKGRIMLTINSDVWIGSNSVIAANIGRRCVIGAGSVLVKSTEDNCVYAGNPARLIKKMPTTEIPIK